MANVRERITSASETFTAAERRISALVLSDYPYSGLDPITQVSERSHASPASVSRFIQKLGFDGFQDFQRHLISELREGQRSPTQIREATQPVESSFLTTFLERSEGLLASTRDLVTEQQFERICALLSDKKRSIYISGGRISASIMHYFAWHLQYARRDVFVLPSDPEYWPQQILQLRRGDVLILSDYRRYDSRLLPLAQAARNRKADVVLLTDTWISPISAHATEILTIPIYTDTLWDSYTPVLSVLEALATQVAEKNWNDVKDRLASWDEIRTEQRGYMNEQSAYMNEEHRDT